MRPLRVADLWSWKGTIDRAPYALWGVVLALAKLAIDQAIWPEVRDPGVHWPWIYWVPGRLLGALSSSPEQGRALLPVALAALPFAWSGIVLTLARLRSAGLPTGLVLLFFVPVVNVLLFLVLCALPAQPGKTEGLSARARSLLRIAPRDPFASAALSVVLVVPPSTGLVFLAASRLGDYGWGLFLGIPFLLGLAAAWIHGYREPRSLRGSIAVAMAALGLTALAILLCALEGVICILMAIPIALPIALLGACVGHVLQRSRTPAEPGAVLGGIALFFPLFCALEKRVEPQPEWIELSTALDVAAPPEIVWREIVAFAELPPPTELLFRAGVAYPIRAEIEGSGVGAVRRCVFSTGAFVEPIEVWDEPRALEFGVVEQPPSMRELSPYPEIAAPHLEHYLESHRGRFLLVPLEGGGTRLVGTTWYSNRMWPSGYWRLWSDAIIHSIHRRVLEAIRARAEARAPAHSSSGTR